ncbi:MAG: hypothetical protein J3Q66DRAFT_406131 [Benniella sp.]|nr:MAG: hypothetical protein J3Q66DRAFT_406131 [Benniella sp.]
MKFSSASALFGALSLALVSLAPTPVQACERECQVNVSLAFADKYKVVSGDYFTILSQKLDESLFYGVPEDLKEPVVKAFQADITKVKTVWDDSLFKTVFDTIFKDEPKFKGDCNHPPRVRQPPRGVNWVMSDCHKMDYICGNPPSICHFMPMIKHRISSKLSNQLVTLIDGDTSDLFANYLSHSLTKVVEDYPELEQYRANFHGNLDQIMTTVGDLATKEFAGDGQWEWGWDTEIKELLLTFP